MLQLAWPWVFAALPIPIIARALLPPAVGGHRAAVRFPAFRQVRAWRGAGALVGTRRWHRAVAVLTWLALVLAAARPQWIGEPVSVPITGRDIVLALDLSGSMERRDQLVGGRIVDRLAAVKHVAGDFIERRLGDRVGIVLFGTNPYVQVPLTFDRQAARRLLGEAVIGLAGGQTAIGDAIGLSVYLLRERPAGSRVVVLLTDGENTFGRLDPMAAARLAAFHGLRIHTIGFGSPAEMADGGALAAGRLDERTLAEIARTTGGSAFRAEDTAGLEAVYRLLDAIEPAADHDDIVRPPVELFYWPLGAAYALLAMAVLGGLAAAARRARQAVIPGEGRAWARSSS